MNAWSHFQEYPEVYSGEFPAIQNHTPCILSNASPYQFEWDHAKGRYRCRLKPASRCLLSPYEGVPHPPPHSQRLAAPCGVGHFSSPVSNGKSRKHHIRSLALHNWGNVSHRFGTPDVPECDGRLSFVAGLRRGLLQSGG